MMKAKTKNMLKSVIVLCLIAAVSGLLLGFVSKITYIDPLTESLKKFNKLSGASGAFELLKQDDGDVLFFAKTNDETPVYAFLSKGGGGYKGTVEMYVFIKDNKIFKIAQGNNSETFFKTVEKVKDNANFYDKFYNIDLITAKDFSTKKADLVTGATLTSTAVTNAVNAAKAYYVKYIEQTALQTGGTN